jgi:hypothetical protein
LAICLLITIGYVRADNANSAYSAPQASSGYAAPAAAAPSYAAPAAPSYNAPTGGAAYAAPATGYEAAPAYDYAAPAYDAPADVGGFGGFDLSGLWPLIPLFLIVLAAIIVAALLAPFIAQLAVIGVGILPMALSIKAPIVNAILLPFGLTLCNRGPPVTAFTGTANTGRELADTFGLDLSEDQIELISNFATAAFDTLKSKFQNKN